MLLLKPFLIIIFKELFMTFDELLLALFKLLNQPLSLFMKLILLLAELEYDCVCIFIVFLQFAAFFFWPFQ